MPGNFNITCTKEGKYGKTARRIHKSSRDRQLDKICVLSYRPDFVFLAAVAARGGSGDGDGVWH